MKKTALRIRFKARLLPPANVRGDPWVFLILPENASAKLPTRRMTTVEGTLNNHPFQAALSPDGRRGHWLKVTRRLREAAGAKVGDFVEMVIASVKKEPESRVPTDLRKALAADSKVQVVWNGITPIARRDWIQWVTSTKQSETRVRRIKHACEMLAGGMPRISCFDLPEINNRCSILPKRRIKRRIRRIKRRSPS